MDDDDVKRLYANLLTQLVGLVEPQHLRAIAGRGSGKTSAVLAQRSKSIIAALPRHNIAWACTTYEDFYSNVLPAVLEGWEREGWHDGVHYVVNRQPPDSWRFQDIDPPYRQVKNFKNTIIARNRAVVYIASFARLDSLVGGSYVHVLADEVRRIIYQKLLRLLPALRGQGRGTDSPYFLGTTFTTDYPDEFSGDDPWILDSAADMDVEQIMDILALAQTKNALLQVVPADECEKTELDACLTDLQMKLNARRRDSTLFLRVSSFVNAPVLGADYFNNLSKFLSQESMRVSVLSLPPQSGAIKAFYPSFNMDLHTYSSPVQQQGEYPQDGQGAGTGASTQKYYNPDAPVQVSMDFGTNMTSLLITQESPDGNEIRFLKSLYVLRPEDIRSMVFKFLSFMADHRMRIVDYYYDRSGNTQHEVDSAAEAELFRTLVQESVAYQGWLVVPQSENMRTIYHSEEFFLVDAMLSGRIPGFPSVLIDRENCAELIASIQGAKMLQSTGADGKLHIKKDKSKEKNFRSLDELPTKSTNLSDAFKYRLCTKRYLAMMPRGQQGFFTL